MLQAHRLVCPNREREQVLLLIASITTTNNLLIAHISMINGDPNGLGNSFEGIATHLMLAGPIEKNVKSKRSESALMSFVLAGRGSNGVDLRWYNRNEFKQLTQEQ